MMRKSLIAVSVLALGALAFGGASSTDVSTLTFGKVLMGPAVSQESLAGKVVLLEFWGTH